jgi:ribosome-binding protein aMBF1 (putative translation factor)
MKNDMPETIYADVGESIYREGSWSRTEELAHKYTHVENLIARIEAMKRTMISQTDQQHFEDRGFNAALSAVIDMLGQKEGA